VDVFSFIGQEPCPFSVLKKLYVEYPIQGTNMEKSIPDAGS